MSYEQATKASFDAAKKHLDFVTKYGVPHQVYDAYKEPDDQVGAAIPLEQANSLLAPYNMVLHVSNKGRWYVLTVLDGDKLWPSNWDRVGDTLVMGIDAKPYARFGRKKWQFPPEVNQ